MKRLIILGLGLGMLALGGCATTTKGPVYAGTFGMAKGPVSSAGKTEFSKIGKATCTSVLGMFGSGDCTIKTAAKNGGITEISSVDSEVLSVLGLFASYTTVVHGN